MMQNGRITPHSPRRAAGLLAPLAAPPPHSHRPAPHASTKTWKKDEGSGTAGADEHNPEQALRITSIDDKFVKDISVQTSGFMPRDILALVTDARVSFAHKVALEKSSNDELEDALTASSSTTQKEEKQFCKEDILSSLEWAKKRNRAALGTPKVPDVKWEDVGGLEEVKKVILDTIQLCGPGDVVCY
ncbi:hypothetical protein ZWY2020_042962 [Hordeum vulgare]|nr:hypothetical protein ZWY2020_042962 [Hordeum vulgare]